MNGPDSVTSRRSNLVGRLHGAVLWILLGLFVPKSLFAARTDMPSRVKESADPVKSVPSPKARLHGLRPARHVGLPAPDLASVREEDEKVAGKADGKAPRRIGIKRPIGTLAPASTEWTLLPDGTRVWSARLGSDGALGIRLHFTGVRLPKDSYFIVYEAGNPDRVEGPFDAAYLGGRDSFWSSTVFASEVVVEAVVPVEEPDAAFEIGELTHNYRSPGEDQAKNAGSCEINFACEFTEWGTTGNAVSGIGAVSAAGSLFCTGCLLNDENPAAGTDYYLTANHCISGQSEADTLEFYWLYQTATCTSAEPNPATVPRTRGGADILSRRARGSGTDQNDHSFLRLRGTVPSGVTYAGWTIDSPAAGEDITCIHHPDGDYKRISHGTVDAALSTTNFWNIRWAPGRGVTEPGSSGGPIFNARKQVIGQLFGGPSSCANTDPAQQNDDFGRFAITFRHVRAWLLNETPPPPPAAPTNDLFATPRLLTGAAGTVADDSTDAGRQSGEPTITDNGGGAMLWYSWTAPANGTATFTTAGSSFDTLLGVFRGTALGSLTVVGENDDAGNGNLTSRVQFTATAGVTYRIAVDGYGGEAGAVVLNWTSTGAPTNNDRFADATVLRGGRGQANGTNVGYTRETGEPTHQSTGTPAANVGQRTAWWSWIAPASGAVVIDTAGSAFDTVLAVYTGTSVTALTPVAQNDDANSQLLTSRVEFGAVAGTTYRIVVDGYRSTAGTQSEGAIVLNWVGQAGLTGNDSFANAVVLTGTSGSAVGSNTNYTHEVGEPGHADNANQASAWWRWTAEVGGDVRFITAGSSFDTVLAVYTGTAVNALVRVGSNDDVSTNDLTSSVGFTAVAGTVYHIAVDGYRSQSTGVQEMGAIRLGWAGSSLPTSNDRFADARLLSGNSGQVLGSNVGYSRETGEPSHAAGSGVRSAWWTWTAPTNGALILNTEGSGFDTLLAAYVGADVAALSLVTENDDSGGSGVRTSRITFDATAGTVYRIAVDGYDASSGAITLNWVFTPSGGGGGGGGGTGQPDLTVWVPSLNPRVELRTFAAGDCSVNEGCGVVGRRRLLTFDTEVRNQGTADVRLGVAGPGNTNFVWDPCHGHYHWLNYANYRLVGTNGVLATGRKVGFCLLDSIHWSTTNGPATSRYDCQNQGISAGWGDVYGRNLSCQWIDITDVPDGDYWLEVEVDPANQFAESDESNNVGRIAVQIRPVVVPANDTIAAAREIHGVSGYVHGNNSGATADPGDPEVGSGATVWFRWIAPCTGTAVFDTEGTFFDTVLGVYRGTNTAALTRIALNDDAPGGTWSRVSFAATEGVAYLVAFDSYSASETGRHRLHWVLQGGACPPAPRPLPIERPLANGPFTVGFFGETGETYAMDVSEDISNPAGWVRLLTTTGEGRSMTFTDNSANQHVLRYYRIVQVVP